jgi:hypothetical protein
MRTVLFLLFLSISLISVAQEPDSSSALFNLREAERNFARASASFGRKEAFQEYLAKGSIIFTDKWITNGKEFWQNRKAAPSILKWEPEFMDISESLDFGISTGPWEAQEYRPYTRPLANGYFLSVWEKQQGVWKVILDAGIVTPPDLTHVHTFSSPSVSDRKINSINIATGKKAAEELVQQEVKFLDSWKSNNVSEYMSFLSPDARMMLNGHLPVTDNDSVKSWISKRDRAVLWASEGSGIARSGDLGFTYGYLQKSGQAAGNYVRIWKKFSEGWKIIIEMMNPSIK